MLQYIPSGSSSTVHQVYPTEYIFTTATNNVSDLENCTSYKNRSDFTRCQHPSVLTDSQQCDSQLLGKNSNSIETVQNGRILFRFAMITNITCVEFCYHAMQDLQDPTVRFLKVVYYNESDGYEPWRAPTSSMPQGSHRLDFDISRTHDFKASISAKNVVLSFTIRGNSTLRLKEVKFYTTSPIVPTTQTTITRTSTRSQPTTPKSSADHQPTTLISTERSTGPQPTELVTTENFTRHHPTTRSTEFTATAGSAQPKNLVTTESSTGSMVPLVIGVVAAAVIILAVILGVTCLVAITVHRRHSKNVFKLFPKQTEELTLDSTEKLELAAVHSADSMLEIDNPYNASLENSSQHIQKHDDDKHDHNYSVIESSGDGNPASLYASIPEKVETREERSTSEGREDTHTYSVVNKKLTKENKSHTPEGQDDIHVYSVVNKKLAKEKANEEMDEQDEASVHKKIEISKEFPRPEGQDDSHVYSVVNKKERQSTKQNEAPKELCTPEGQDDSHIYSVVKKKLTKERVNEEMDESIEISVQKKTKTPKELVKKKFTKESTKEETAKHNKASEKKTEMLKELCMPESKDESHIYSVVKKKFTKEKETCNEEANTLLYAVTDKKKTAEAPADLEESTLISPRDHTLFTKEKSPQMSTDNCEEEVTIEDQSNGSIRMEV